MVGIPVLWIYKTDKFFMALNKILWKNVAESFGRIGTENSHHGFSLM